MQTLIGCPTLEAQERAILTLIGSAPRVIANGDGRLTLSAGSRTMVIERDTAPLPPQPVDPWRGTPLLAGTKWVLGGIDGAWGNLKGRTLTFEADRWLLASPCGTRGGAWRQTGDRIVADAPDPAPAVSCAAEAAAMDASLVAMIEADPRFVTGPNGEILIGGGGHWVTGDGPRAQLKDDVPLAGTWRIVAIDEAPPAGEGPLQVEFGPSDYSGTTGCNSFQGVYIAHSRRFFSDPPIRTQRACGGPLDAQEKRIAGLLANGPRVAFAGNGDILLVDEGGSLRLSRQTAAGSSPPVGRLWRGEPLEAELIRLDGRPLQSRPSDPVTRLRLSAQRFDINTGCGRFGGIWRVRSGELEFLTDPEPPPEGACAGALAERLSTFSRLFNGRAQVLIGPNGELILAGEQHWLTGRVRRPSTTRR
jgi:heat shock protein HslJ